MDRKEICSVGDVLRQVITDNSMADRLDELKAADFWPAIIGEYIAEQTMKPYVRNGAMSIRVPDAALRQELTMNRTRIMQEFNRLCGHEVITSLRFIS